MQSTKRDIYLKVSSLYDVPFDLVESIGDFVMKEWALWQRNPDNLGLKVRNLGTQFLGYKKNINLISKIKRSGLDYDNVDNNVFRTHLEKEKFNEEVEFIKNLEYLLNTSYPLYKEKKRQIKIKNGENNIS